MHPRNIALVTSLALPLVVFACTTATSANDTDNPGDAASDTRSMNDGATSDSSSDTASLDATVEPVDAATAACTARCLVPTYTCAFKSPGATTPGSATITVEASCAGELSVQKQVVPYFIDCAKSRLCFGVPSKFLEKECYPLTTDATSFTYTIPSQGKTTTCTEAP